MCGNICNSMAWCNKCDNAVVAAAIVAVVAVDAAAVVSDATAFAMWLNVVLRLRQN